MTMPTLVLASASPRRRQLLEMLGIPILVQPASVQEIPLPGESPEKYSLRLARDKARAVPGRLVLGADTIVVLDDEILEKPAGPEEALEMLMRLQGREHHVVTAISLMADGVERQAHDRTAVRMREADIDWLRSYVATGEPLDKAGSYGIQGVGAVLVERVEGDYFSVMGLPIRLVVRLLEEAGFKYQFGRSEAP